MKLKHRVNITVSDNDGNRQPILQAADRWIPRWLARMLFGNYQQMYLITPGKSIEDIQIKEVLHENE